MQLRTAFALGLGPRVPLAGILTSAADVQAKSPTVPRMALLTPRLGRECSTDCASVPGGLVLH